MNRPCVTTNSQLQAIEIKKMQRERKREIVGVWNGKGERDVEEEEKDAVMISP